MKTSWPFMEVLDRLEKRDPGRDYLVPNSYESSKCTTSVV
jgi:hypothetical protein